jgi:formamidopyrimidine-DNA glycosylase
VPLIVGKSVDQVVIHNGSLRWPVPDDLMDILPGQKVLDVGRRSKYLLLQFERGTLILHLGMSGHLRVVPQETELRKHDHVEIVFTDGSVLRYNDPRRFGSMLWTGVDPLTHPRLVDLGPEPLCHDFHAAGLYKLSRHRRIAVKSFLMDARTVVGVGNIYASEALFRAGIDPQREAGKVSRAAYEKVVAAIKEVLSEAIAAGGTTIRDFAGTDGKPGYFKQELRVYGRTDQPCVTCQAPIRQIRLGQRSTYYCARCQR